MSIVASLGNMVVPIPNAELVQVTNPTAENDRGSLGSVSPYYYTAHRVCVMRFCLRTATRTSPTILTLSVVLPLLEVLGLLL